jgi:hypothetical protein
MAVLVSTYLLVLLQQVAQGLQAVQVRLVVVLVLLETVAMLLDQMVAQAVLVVVAQVQQHQVAPAAQEYFIFSIRRSQ